MIGPRQSHSADGTPREKSCLSFQPNIKFCFSCCCKCVCC